LFALEHLQALLFNGARKGAKTHSFSRNHIFLAKWPTITSHLQGGRLGLAMGMG
jgi:hypothetical protein